MPTNGTIKTAPDVGNDSILCSPAEEFSFATIQISHAMSVSRIQKTAEPSHAL